MYTEKVMKHFHNPANMGKIANPDGVGKVGNMACGDMMYMYIKVAKNKQGEDIIKDIKFQTFGCVAAIATSSVITELVKGKPLSDALKVNNTDIMQSLSGLPPIKVHCSVLATEALSDAIYDHYKRNKKPISKELKAKHEDIVRHNKMLEEQYKEYLDTQELE
ncbi:iron-sulfur cluster assembly scaffold protein [Patescibacteria group bacterium]|nr:iron-sulfur cluster assembly scaffold protein [Patescibacteria group bacterium]MBU1952854.1 iron-sulfur cluster assembly scaffold protein [Patescibacteria group bacterium]